MKKIILATLCVLLFTACNQNKNDKQFDKGKIEMQVYTNDEIGWKINVPEGWTLVSLDQTAKQNEIGKQALENRLQQPIDASGLKNLLSFQKDQFNVFQSCYEPFKEEHNGDWLENNKKIQDLVYDTFESLGLKVDSSETSFEKIEDLIFHKKVFTLYAPSGEKILTQIMYSKLINGLDFGVSISYNNEKYKEELLRAFRRSKFSTSKEE